MAFRVQSTPHAAVCLLVLITLTLAPGCGTEQFLGLEDYQRDLLLGGLAGALLAQQLGDGDQPDNDGSGRPGAARDGTNCWDLNGNFANDPAEDRNQDGVFDARDCQGPPGPPGDDGADGLDAAAGTDGLACWDLNGDGSPDPTEDQNGDGHVDVLDCQGPTGPTGPSGPAGPPGSDAPEFFDIFIDDFFVSGPTPDRGLQVVAIPITEPFLGSGPDGKDPNDPLAFRFAIPGTYDAASDVTMRLFLYRRGIMNGECFAFSVDGRRLRGGSGMDVYDHAPRSLAACTAEPASPGCGRRWVRVEAGEATTDALLVVDLPLNNVPPRNGLAYPRDLRGRDLLAFELRTFRGDGRSYQLLGIEVFESPANSASPVGAVVFPASDEVTCASADCNDNGVEDAVEIMECPSSDTHCQDCNLNGVPDECDLCDGALHGPLFGAEGEAAPFIFLQEGFTQDLYATAPEFMGGLAFAPDGDLWVDRCPASRLSSPLRRFDAQQTTLVNGAALHPLIAALPSNAGCGLTNHPNGTLYSNTSLGITQLDADSGGQIGEPLGIKGNGLGIAIDPLTTDVVYVAADGTLYRADAELTTYGEFSTALSGKFVAGMAFDPSGEFLFLANRSDQALAIVRRDGSLVQHVPVLDNGGLHEPNGVAVHTGATSHQAFRQTSALQDGGQLGPLFIVTSNLDGTITRFDFPNDDFTRIPNLSVFASGGFRGDLVQVGPDHCLYVTQNMTRFSDGTVTEDNSVVRICSGFHPPVPPHVALSPRHAFNVLGTQHTVVASVLNPASDPAAGVAVVFEILPGGPNEGVSGVRTTDETGTALFTYSGDGGIGTDRIQARLEDAGNLRFSNIVAKTWLPAGCSLDCNENGIPDECDIAEGTSEDCQPDGIPDECDGDCK